MSIPTTMKAWLFKDVVPNGLDEKLYFSNTTSLPPKSKNLKKDEFLVKVLSTGLNPVDYKIAELPYLGKLNLRQRPSIPGMDFSGKIILSGHQSELKPGELIFGNLAKPQQFGTLGEYIIVTRSEFAILPQGLNIIEAGGIGVGAITAYQSIVPYIKSQGKNIFINAGSGGTGTFGIQTGKILGCHVVTSCSEKNIEFVKNLGADEVIDYRKVDVVKELKRIGTTRKFDLIVDNVGNLPSLFWNMHEFTTSEAKFIQVGIEVNWSSLFNIIKFSSWPSILGGGKRGYVLLQVVGKPEEYYQIGQWMKEGKLKTIVEEVFSYQDAPKAFTKLKTGRVKGKVVVKVGDS